MLEIKNVHKTFNPGTINEKKALNGIDLTLNEGDFVTVIGGNGAGKSTMLNMIAGVYPVDCGSIVIDGVDVTKLPEHKRAKYIGRVFQDPMTGTAANMQIIENLALASRRGSRRGLGAGVKRKEKEHYKEVLKHLDLGLERIDLHQRLACFRAVSVRLLHFLWQHSASQSFCFLMSIQPHLTLKQPKKCLI